MSNATRKTVIAGNWKMNTDLEAAVALARGVASSSPEAEGLDVLLIPPAPFLGAVVEAISGTRVQVGAQNMHPAASGAYTGEMSGAMLRSVGVTHVVCGHSERRHVFGESNTFVGEKVAAAHEHGLVPILCVGETLEDREAGRTQQVVLAQLEDGLGDLDAARVQSTIIAYEPVWAIGTGLTATPDQAQEVHGQIRSRLSELYGADTAAAITIQYGGSVKAANAAQLLACADIDGALVGGASLTVDGFLPIIAAGAEN